MLIILSGQTAVGKTVIEKELEKKGLYRAISYSTRPRRSNEKNGIDYHFMNNEDFDNLYSKGVLYEKTSYIVNGEKWQYGLGPKSFKKGIHNVVTVNPHGLKQLVENKRLQEKIVVFHMVAPLDIRKKRYLERETSPEKEKNLQQRILQDEKDFVLDNGIERSGAQDVVVIKNYNKTIEDTVEEIYRETIKRG